MSASTFNPSEHLIPLSGKDYLPVAWRLVWFRTACPLGSIDTECLYQDHERALFKATVRMHSLQMDDTVVTDIPSCATGHGSETIKDFRDYIEKAETKAIGRALAALGFGTQFAPELDEGERIVDAPVQRPTNRTPEVQRMTRTAPASPPQGTPAQTGFAASQQLSAIARLWKEAGYPDAEIGARMMADFGGKDSSDQLTTAEAGKFIEQLQREATARRRVLQATGAAAGRHESAAGADGEFDAHHARPRRR